MRQQVIPLSILAVLALAGVLYFTFYTDEPTLAAKPSVGPAADDTDPKPKKVVTDSPMFRGNPQRTGYFPTALNLNRKKSRSMLFFGSNDKFIYALDARTGDLIWKKETGGKVVSSPCVINGTVYIGSNDGKLYALDALGGQERWTFPTGLMVHASSVVKNGFVYFGAGKKLFSVRAKTGRKVWSLSVDSQLYSSPAVNDKAMFISTLNGTFYCIDYTKGKILWKLPKRSTSEEGSALVEENRVFVSSGENIFRALAASDGRELWAFDSKASTHSSATISGDRIFLGNSVGNIFALNKKTGEQIWKRRTNGEAGVTRAICLVEGMLYLSSARGFWALGAEKGEIRWFKYIGASSKSSPAFYNGTVFFGAYDKNFYALNAKDGKILWKFSTNGRIDSSPAVAD